MLFFFSKTLVNAHVIVQVLKRLLIKNVWIIVSTLQHFWGDVIAVFIANGGYLLRANPLGTTSAVSVHLQ
ncbi:hypothetical protein AB205_0035500 [Aquarana catesbeiana]|uniref:Uncharacterized protein n=1 Tax=Aquarana catesbeiana TaxID=8400 RepID=A0A2G9Q3G6_AQUCT|nr:hypothetical protein AB205_0035500 [Aquarana catesbeiana]